MENMNLNSQHNIIFIVMCYSHRKNINSLASVGFSFWEALKVYDKSCHKNLSLSPRLVHNYLVIQDKLGCYYRKLPFSSEKEILVRHQEIIEVVFHSCSFLNNGGHLSLIQVLKYETIYQWNFNVSEGKSNITKLPKQIRFFSFTEILNKRILPGVFVPSYFVNTTNWAIFVVRVCLIFIAVI